jgi:hypothetical protein
MTPHASASSICMPTFLASACATSFRLSAWSTLNERLHSARLAAGAAADVEYSSRLMRTCIFSAIYLTHAAPEAHARQRRPSSIKATVGTLWSQQTLVAHCSLFIVAMFAKSALVLAAVAAGAHALATPRSLPTGTVTCGSDKYSVSAISAAISQGYKYYQSGQTVGTSYPSYLWR